MKKLLGLSLITLLCLPLSVYAASIGGAETQGQGKLAIGLDTSFVFNKDLKFKSLTETSGLGSPQKTKNIKIDKNEQIMLKTSYGLLDNLDVYLKLGATDSKAKDNFYEGNAHYGDDKINTDTGFAYGFGLKGTYELENSWFIGYDLQYLRSEQKAKVIETVVATGESDSTKYKSLVVQEWHIAPYIAKRINDFTPYFGVRYSDMKVKMKKPSGSGWTDDHKYKADDNVGVFLGTDYKVTDNWTLNLEGRFIDETATSFACTYKF